MARFNVPITHVISGDAASSGVGYKLNFYKTLTTTRKDTFSDSALATANSNPIVADSSGRFGDIFLESGTYRVILTDASDVTIWDADNVDGSTGTSGVVDNKSGAYTVTVGDSSKVIDVDATSGAVTITLLPAATAADGFEVTVRKSDSSANAVTIDGNGAETINGATTLVLLSQYQSATLRCDGAAWLRTSWGLDTANTWAKTQTWTKGADIASATSMALGKDGNSFDVTGTTQTDTITGTAGTDFLLQYDDAVTLTDSATLDLKGADITTAAGDVLALTMLTDSLAQLISRPVFEGEGAMRLATQAIMETATSNTALVSPGRMKNHPGVAKYHVYFEGDGDPDGTKVGHNNGTITDNGAGSYTLAFTESLSAATYSATVNGATDTTGADVLAARNVAVVDQATGSCRVDCEDDASTQFDPGEVSVIIMGDL